MATETFFTSGLIVHERAWYDVYPYERWAGKEIPEFAEGQRFVPAVLELAPGRTRPPERLKESDLIGLMERNGIGTDATMAQHIDKILARGYCTREEGTMQFWPTELGEALVMACREMGIEALWEPFLRGEMERLLNEIAAGSLPKGDFLELALRDFEAQYANTAQQTPLLLQVFPPTRPRFLSRAEPGWRHSRREDRCPRVLPDGRQERHRGDVQGPGGGPSIQEQAGQQPGTSLIHALSPHIPHLHQVSSVLF